MTASRNGAPATFQGDTWRSGHFPRGSRRSDHSSERTRGAPATSRGDTWRSDHFLRGLLRSDHSSGDDTWRSGQFMAPPPHRRVPVGARPHAIPPIERLPARVCDRDNEYGVLVHAVHETIRELLQKGDARFACGCTDRPRMLEKTLHRGSRICRVRSVIEAASSLTGVRSRWSATMPSTSSRWSLR